MGYSWFNEKYKTPLKLLSIFELGGRKLSRSKAAKICAQTFGNVMMENGILNILNILILILTIGNSPSVPDAVSTLVGYVCVFQVFIYPHSFELLTALER